DYTPLSVTTTSVHDSSTLRQWWEDEKESVKAFVMANAECFGIETGAEDGPLFTAPREEIEKKAEAVAKEAFTPELAEELLKASATSASQWFIPPLQDFLYMDKSLWLDKASDERINVPGTVTEFNWTYRLPCTLEELIKNTSLIAKIKAVSER
ncbi:MAG: 4-alpha-glucanotransferase, partial [Treponema sp.]|nr:4-alpha-glucanotransferase [Treponema sp.]